MNKHPTERFRCFVFDKLFGSCEVLRASKSKRPDNAFQYVVTLVLANLCLASWKLGSRSARRRQSFALCAITDKSVSTLLTRDHKNRLQFYNF